MISSTPTDIKPFRLNFGLRLALLILIALGIISLYLTYMEDQSKAWANLLLGSTLFLGFGLFGFFFTAIQHLTSARWSVGLRRVMETMALTLPVAALLFVAVAGPGLHHLYEWSHAHVVANDELLQWKAHILGGFLVPDNFRYRLAFYFIVWIVGTIVLVRNSFRQDITGDANISTKNLRWSAFFLVLFGLTCSGAGFDLLMSLEPHWFSTIFGVYFFAGFFQAGLAMLYLLAYLLYRAGTFERIISVDHFHDIARFMFGFSIFWAYIGFSQFMLIWYGDLPEETFYYLVRMEKGWQWLSLALLGIRFVVPFLVLMPFGAKRNFKVGLSMVIVIFLGQWLDLYWMIKPALRLGAEGQEIISSSIGWKELGVGVGFISLFVLVVSTIMQKVRMIPVKDPRLETSIHYYHHG